MEVAIGIDVDHVRLPVGGHPQIHSAVIAAVKRLECGERGVDQSSLSLLVQRAERGRTVDALRGVQLPLGAIGENLRPLLERLAELNLGQRERAMRTVAENRDIDLPAVDVSLHQSWLPEGGQHLASGAAQPSAISHHRVEVHPKRGILPHRFDDQRKG